MTTSALLAASQREHYAAGPMEATKGGGPIQAVSTTNAPGAIGPYSQAVRAGGLLFLSGQIALDPATGQLIAGGVEAETKRVMENLAAILAAGGGSFRDVARSTIYLVDLAHFAAVNAVYASYFEAPYPARATVQVAALPRGAQVEIDMVAVAR
jgi:reactive intermediate/imine deaminase